MINLPEWLKTYLGQGSASVSFSRHPEFISGSDKWTGVNISKKPN